ncbi:MAG: 6-phosphogluconolactonase [Yoonia sp.]|jgi:6-phosphogluconolactonase
MPVWTNYSDPKIQARSLAAIVAGQLATALSKKGRATLAVPGGTTPAAFLRALSKADLDWLNISVLLTDERFVPETSPRSNTALLRSTLFQGKAAAAQFVPLYQQADQPEDVLNLLSDAVRAVLPLDVCVVGMGSDMHTASLFPGADHLTQALDPTQDTVLLPMRAPSAPEPRMTLTARVLQAATNLHLLIIGPEKLAALKSAEQPGPASKAPVRVILNAPTNVTIHYAEQAGGK